MPEVGVSQVRKSLDAAIAAQGKVQDAAKKAAQEIRDSRAPAPKEPPK